MHLSATYVDVQSVYPGGTRGNDGLETGIMGGCGRENSVEEWRC